MKNLNKISNKDQKFMSLKKISLGYDVNPQWALDNWMQDPLTLESIQLWENLHNPSFDNENYIEICSSSLANSCAPVLQELVDKTNLSCIFIAKCNSSDIMLHKDIAIDFASWLSPAFKAYCSYNLLNSNVTDLKLRSEEDYVISKCSLAKIYKEDAFNEFIEVTKNNINDLENNYKYFVHANKIR